MQGKGSSLPVTGSGDGASSSGGSTSASDAAGGNARLVHSSSVLPAWLRTSSSAKVVTTAAVLLLLAALGIGLGVGLPPLLERHWSSSNGSSSAGGWSRPQGKEAGRT